MTGAQIAMAAGALVALGIVLGAWRLVPPAPNLGDVVTRLSPHPRRQPATPTVTVGGSVDRRERLGLWAMRHLPAGVWGRVPAQELALLRMSVPRYLGEKLALALIGLFTPSLWTAAASLSGLHPPLVLPVLGSLGLAVGGWFLPNLNIASEAKQARAEFNQALGAYIDLVALERNAGSAPRQAMETAAGVGNCWVFQRIGEELARSRWSGEAPWDALKVLADELGVSDLADLADIMRLFGEEGAQVWITLRARSTALRTAMLTHEQGKANETSERMVLPGAVLGMVFIAMLLTPPLLRLLAS